MPQESHWCNLGKVAEVVVIPTGNDTPKTGTIETICPGCKFHNRKYVIPVDWGIKLNRLGRISGCAVNQLPLNN